MQPETKDVEAVVPFMDYTLINSGLQGAGNMQVEMFFLRNPSKEEIEHYRFAMEDVLGKNKYFTILFDASKLTSLTHASLLKARIAEVEKQQNEKAVGCALILPGGKLMKTMQNLFLKKTPYPLKVCADLKEAREFLQQFATTVA